MAFGEERLKECEKTITEVITKNMLKFFKKQSQGSQSSEQKIQVTKNDIVVIAITMFKKIEGLEDLWVLAIWRWI